jgi:DNA-binding IclR family transcriptional regulator
VQILEEKGIAAHPAMTMKQIANQVGLHPSQLRQILTTP